jgi:hypothetical protein
LHGLDPLDFANLEGLRDYVQSLGFLKTHYGYWYHLFRFRKEICQVHQDDPDARFVVIGFSYGTCMSRELVNLIKDDGVTIDLLVYLSGSILRNTARTCPDNVLHVVNIQSLGDGLTGAELDRADNIHVRNVMHFGSPTHPRTQEVLARELAVVAERVPVVLPPDPPPPLEEEAPRPRPLHEGPAEPEQGHNADWDFLKPGAVQELPPPRTEDSKFNRPSPTYRPDTGSSPTPTPR